MKNKLVSYYEIFADDAGREFNHIKRILDEDISCDLDRG